MSWFRNEWFAAEQFASEWFGPAAASGSPGEGSPAPVVTSQGYVRRPRRVLPVDPLLAQQLDEDELILLLLMQAIATGTMH